MTEAVEATLEYKFSNTDMAILLVGNLVGNVRSRRVKEKTGAKFLGVFERKEPCKGITHEDRWELTKESWQAHKLKMGTEREGSK